MERTTYANVAETTIRTVFELANQNREIDLICEGLEDVDLCQRLRNMAASNDRVASANKELGRYFQNKECNSLGSNVKEAIGAEVVAKVMAEVKNAQAVPLSRDATPRLPIESPPGSFNTKLPPAVPSQAPCEQTPTLTNPTTSHKSRQTLPPRLSVWGEVC